MNLSKWDFQEIAFLVTLQTLYNVAGQNFMTWPRWSNRIYLKHDTMVTKKGLVHAGHGSRWMWHSVNALLYNAWI